MGYYINPEKMSKEEFLTRFGTPVQFISESEVDRIWNDCPTDSLPVVWLHNGPFTAAGIAYDKEELQAFIPDRDPRPKKIYYVAKDLLAPFYTSAPTSAPKD